MRISWRCRLAIRPGAPAAKPWRDWRGGFFRAGARGLFVSHWDVASGAAMPLMIGTFGTGGGARDSAQALRAAQLRMIDTAGSGTQAPIEISHPNFWGAFVLIGDGVRGGPGA